MDWHARYTQQANWTAQTRRYLYEKAGLSKTARVLEPGCGTGAVLVDCPLEPSTGWTGMRSFYRSRVERSRAPAWWTLTQFPCRMLPPALTPA